MLGYSDTQFTAGFLVLFLAFLSLLGTLTTLYLIYDMKRRNGYLLLIFNLTVSQIFYDVPFFLLPFYKELAVEDVMNFGFTFAGLAVAFWTNVVSLVLYNIVKNLRSFDIYAHYNLFAALVFVPSLTLAVLIEVYARDAAAVLAVNKTYYWVRIASIAFNVVVHALISLKLHRMGYAAAGAAADDPVRALAARIKYYPIVQVVTRAGAAWYELAYGYDTGTFGDQGMGATQQVSLICYALCAPSAGIGYFAVFLIVQPVACDHLLTRLAQLRRALRRRLGCAEEEQEDPELHYKEDSEVGEPSTPSAAELGRTSSKASGGRLLSGVRDLDEDELSQRIDERYQSRSNDTAGTGGPLSPGESRRSSAAVTIQLSTSSRQSAMGAAHSESSWSQPDT